MRQWSKFTEGMWDYYRPLYGDVWIMTPVLNVTASGGSVKKIPDKTEYKLGQTVTLRAVPDDGYEFRAWSGGISGTKNPAKIIMHANHTVTADFTAQKISSSPESK
jgi:hypothetical protein